MQMRHRFMLIAVFVCLLMGVVHAQTVYSDPCGDFSLTIPVGFEPVPPEYTKQDFLCTYLRTGPDGGPLPTTIGIQQLGATISQEYMTDDQAREIALKFPNATSARTFRTSWQGFQINVLEVGMQTPAGPVLSITAEVPLKRNAIRIIVAAPKSDRTEAYRLLNEALATLEGETNWKTGTGKLLDESKPYPAIALGMPVGTVIIGLVILWLISRKAPKATVMILAIMIWLVGAGLGKTEVRMLMLISGSLKMLGFAAGILGIADLLSKRKTKKSAPASPPLPPDAPDIAPPETVPDPPSPDNE